MILAVDFDASTVKPVRAKLCEIWLKRWSFDENKRISLCKCNNESSKSRAEDDWLYERISLSFLFPKLPTISESSETFFELSLSSDYSLVWVLSRSKKIVEAEEIEFE